MSGSGEYSVESVEERVDLVMELAEQQRKFFDEQFTGTPPGYTDPDDDVFVAWYEQQMMMSPPVPMVTPEGRELVASPWSVALAYAENGKAITNRYLRIVQRRESDGDL